MTTQTQKKQQIVRPVKQGTKDKRQTVGITSTSNASKETKGK